MQRVSSELVQTQVTLHSILMKPNLGHTSLHLEVFEVVV